MLSTATRIKMVLVVLLVGGVGILIWPIMDRNSENVWDVGINSRNQRQKRIKLIVTQMPRGQEDVNIAYTIDGGKLKKTELAGVMWTRVVWMNIGARVVLTAHQREPLPFRCRVEDATGRILDYDSRNTKGGVQCYYAVTG